MRNALVHALLVGLQLTRLAQAAPAAPQYPLVPLHELSYSANELYTRLPTLEDATITSLLAGLDARSFTSYELTEAYLNRIELFRDINAILVVAPTALDDAAKADALRRSLPSTSHLPLLGIPFVVKDNIAIPAEAGPTTAGSWALLNATVVEASPVVQRLRNAGGILLSTTNLDEFAQAKGDHPWGWSARGGQMRSIFGAGSNDVGVQEGFADVCGSSGGSALAVALGLSAFALGTQTGVSIVCPSGRAGIAGFKPGQGGKTPVAGVIPISKHLDVVGPIARNVEDTELIWRVIKHPKGWEDPDEGAESDDISFARDRSGAASNVGRHGSRRIRIGVPKEVFQSRLNDPDDDNMPEIPIAINALVDLLRNDSRFAVFDKEVVNITSMTNDSTFDAVGIVTSHELKLGINHYLSNWTLASDFAPRSLGDIISYNVANPSLELPPGPFPAFGHPPRDDEHYADQSFLLKSNSIETSGWKNETYREARKTLERVGWTEGLEPYFWGEDGVDVMLVPTEGSSGTIASLCGVPQVTFPVGFLPSSYPLEANATWPIYPYPDMPFGVSLLASRGHDSHEMVLRVARLIEEVVGFEKQQGRRRERMRTSVRTRLEAAVAV